MEFGGARIHAVAGANGGRDASWSGGTSLVWAPLVASGFGRLGLAGGGVVLFGEFSLFHPAVLVDGALLVVGGHGCVSGVLFSRSRGRRRQLRGRRHESVRKQLSWIVAPVLRGYREVEIGGWDEQPARRSVMFTGLWTSGGDRSWACPCASVRRSTARGSAADVINTIPFAHDSVQRAADGDTAGRVALFLAVLYPSSGPALGGLSPLVSRLAAGNWLGTLSETGG